MKRALMLSILLLVSCKRDGTPPAASEPAPGSPAWKVRSARSAAPADVSANATVRDGNPADSTPGAQLAAGDNGWVCYPDDPRSEAADPICLDDGAMTWMAAWVAHRPPRLTSMAIAYMMQGGLSASDTDPFKMEPDSPQPWIQEPPQLAIAMPSSRSYTGLPTTRRADGPWVKYAGTPYAYIVVPAGAAGGSAR